MSNWWSKRLWTIDDGEGFPSIISCTYLGVTGYAILAFSSQASAEHYKYVHVPNPENKTREFRMKNQAGTPTHVEVAATARNYTDVTTAQKVIAMVIDPMNPEPEWVSIEDAKNLGLEKRRVKKAENELLS